MVDSNQTARKPVVNSTSYSLHWSAEAEDFCQRLAAVVIENTAVSAKPAFHAYRHERHDIFNLVWSVKKNIALYIGWTPAYECDLANADLTPQHGNIEIAVIDNTDAILLSQRVIDIVAKRRSQIV